MSEQAERIEVIESVKIDQVPGTIAFNFEELKAKVEAAVEPYKAMIVTEDGIQNAKKDRAYLNKFITTIEDYRKKEKKKFMAPFDVFEVQEQQLVKIVQDAVANIDIQIKASESAAKEAKRAAITKYFESKAFTIVTLDRIFDQQWLNVSTSTRQWTEDIDNTIERIKFDLDTIDNMAVNDRTTLRGFYMEYLDLKKAKEQYDRNEERIKAAAELEAQRELARQAANRRAEEFAIKPADQKVDVYDEVPLPEQNKEEPSMTITLIINAEPSKIKQVKQFMDNLKINYIETE